MSSQDFGAGVQMPEGSALAGQMLTQEDPMAAQAAQVLEQIKDADPIASTGTFTEAETKQIEDFASKININDTKTIINYGGGVQKQMADFSESVLQNVKTHDLGEVGGMLTGVIADLKSFNPDEEEKGGFLGKRLGVVVNFGFLELNNF